MNHAKTKQGHVLQAGHKVLIPATVARISPMPGHYDTEVILKHRLNNVPTEFILNSSQVELATWPDGEDKPTDRVAPPPEITVARAFNRIKKAFDDDPAKGPGSYRDSFLKTVSQLVLDQHDRLDLKKPEDADKLAELLLEHLFGHEIPEPEQHEPAKTVSDGPPAGLPEQPINPPAGGEVKDSNV